MLSKGTTYIAAAPMAVKFNLEMPLRALNYRLPFLEPEQLSLNNSPGISCRDDE
jgi:hypothetical protein